MSATAHAETLERRQLFAAYIAGSSTAYASIQAAVNAAVSGATIRVDPGTYAEQVTVNKSLTLLGAQAGVDAPGRSGSGSAESVVTGSLSSGLRTSAFYINADNVVLDGFTVQGQTTTSDTMGAGIVIAPKRSGTHIVNNIVQNNVSGLFLANASGSNPALIQHNLFANNNNPGGNNGRGIYTDGTIAGGVMTNVTIDSNTFLNNWGVDKVEAACAFQAGTAGQQSNIRITNNVMRGNGKATLFFNATGIVISNNTITGCIDSGSAALRFEGNIHTVTIQGNTATGNTAPAIGIDAKGTPGDSSDFVVKYNNFYGNNSSTKTPVSFVYAPGSYTGTLDIRNNWWGNVSGPSGDGPGTGDAISAGYVTFNPDETWAFTSGGAETYSPWLTAPYSSAPTIPNAPSALKAVLVTSSQVNLTWTDNSPGNENGFLIDRSTDGINFTQIASTAASAASYTDTLSLPTGTTCFYRIRAYNSLGNSAYSGVASVTVTSTVTTYLSDMVWASATTGYGTIGIDKTVLGLPITLRGMTYAKGIGAHAVSQIVYNLNGNYASFASDVGVDDEVNAKGTGSVRFQVIGDGNVLFDSGVVTNAGAVVRIAVSVAGVKQLTLLATNGVTGIDYDHADWAGARLVSGSSATQTAPAAPSNLAATVLSGQIKLNWTDNSAGSASGFVIQRSVNGGTFTQIGTTAGSLLAYTDSSVLAGTTYSYRVYATNSAGSSGFSNTASATIQQTVTAAIGFVFTALPSSLIAGSAVAYTLAAVDANGKTVPAYTGTVHFTSTDVAAGLPSDYTFVSADAGVHSFLATLKTAGSQKLTVTDNSASLRTISSSIVVIPGAAVTMSVSGPASVSLKVAFTLTITMLDAYGNTATGYRGTVQFTNTDKAAGVPGDYAFKAADAGVHSFKITFKTLGYQTLTIRDKQNSTMWVSLIVLVK